MSARTINERFAGANQLVIYLEGEREHILKEPHVLDTLEEMRRYLLEQVEAGDTRELYTLARNLNRRYHYGDPRWQVIPPDRSITGNLIFVYEASAPISGVILEYTDMVYQNGQFVVFYKDVKGDTVREAIARAKKFMVEHPIEGVSLRLAGGFIGTTAALNEEIESFREAGRPVSHCDGLHPCPFELRFHHCGNPGDACAGCRGGGQLYVCSPLWASVLISTRYQ